MNSDANDGYTEEGWHLSASKYRTSVIRPSPWDTNGEVAVETDVDFQKLLDGRGTGEKFDPCSVRVIERGDSGEGATVEVPAEFRAEYDPHVQRERRYLTWLAHAKTGQRGLYDIYFDVIGRKVPSPSTSDGDLPRENLIENPRFTARSGGQPDGWVLDGADVASFETGTNGGGISGLVIKHDPNAEGRQENAVCVSTRIDVRRYAGQQMYFAARMIAERGVLGRPVTVEIEQYRDDGSRIMEYAIDTRWLTVELAEGHNVEFSERGAFNPEAAEAEVKMRFWLDVEKSCMGLEPTERELETEIWIDNPVLRACERWPWPGANDEMFAEGALEGAAANRAISLTGKRRFVFTGASAGTLSRGSFNPDRRSVHWGPERGTMEFYLRPDWRWDDGEEHLIYEGISMPTDSDSKHSVLLKCGNKHSKLIKLGAEGDNMLEFRIADSSGTVHSVRGKAILQDNKWHHIALTWDHPGACLQIFLDGSLVAVCGPEAEPWPSTDNPEDPELGEGVGTVPGDRRSIPMQLVFGGDLLFRKNSPEILMDELRISDTVRYTDDFQPEFSPFELDEDTRALFHFENTCQGVHHGDDGVIEAFHTHPENPLKSHTYLEYFDGKRVHRSKIDVLPETRAEVFEGNRSENNTSERYLPVKSHPDPRFVRCRRRSVKRKVTGTGEQAPIDVGGDLSPVMLWEAYALAEETESGETRLPRWRAGDNVVPFTYEDLRRTLAPGVEDEVERAVKVFSYCMEVTRYFNANMVLEHVPERDGFVNCSYHLIRMLNMYYSHQCGPLNYPLRKLFILKGISANDYSGTGHQFQQAFFRGGHRLFDNSKRLYWLGRDSRSIIGMRQIHEDPWLMVRHSGNHRAYIPGRPSNARFADNPRPVLDKSPSEEEMQYTLFKPRRPHRIDMALRGGERAFVGWRNEGQWMRRHINGGPLHHGFQPPAYGNGAVVYSPTGNAEDAAERLNLRIEREGDGVLLSPDAEGDSALSYNLSSPYVLTGLQITGKWSGIGPNGLGISVRSDAEEGFEEVWTCESSEGVIEADLSELVAGRYGYELRLDVKAGNESGVVSDVQIRSPFLCSHLSLPGRLKRGRNSIEMVGGPVDRPVTAELAWTERYLSELGVRMPGISYYSPCGRYHKNLFVANPGNTENFEIKLLGEGMKGEVRIEGLPENWVTTPDSIGVEKEDGDSADINFKLCIPDVPEGRIMPYECLIEGDGREGVRRETGVILTSRSALVAETGPHTDIRGDVEVCKAPDLSGGHKVVFNGRGAANFHLKTISAGTYAAWLRIRWQPLQVNAFSLVLDDEPERMLRTCLKPSEWKESEMAYSKMTKNEKDESKVSTPHWGWYRVTGLHLDEGIDHLLSFRADKGTELDALIVVTQKQEVDRAMMNLTQNWNYAPWESPF